jgi:glycerol-3-phosphate dehydrogenase
MAEDCVDQAATLGDLPDRPCVTKTLNIEGFHPNASKFGSLAVYGADAPAILELSATDPSLSQPLDADLPYTGAEVVWTIRHEMARTVEDVLARRLRALFLNAKSAVRMAPRVAALLAQELDRDKAWQLDQVEKFNQLAQGFMVKP